jgi:hypothetical protein
MVIHLLVEGNSIRSTERITGVHHTTILKLLERAGEGCKDLARRKIRAVAVQDLQFDEIWGYVGKKQRRLKPDDNRAVLGDCYCFVALERHSKLVVAWHAGKRNEPSTAYFVTKVRDATTGTFQVSSDAFQAYPGAIAAGLHDRADYAQIISSTAGFQGTEATTTDRRRFEGPFKLP